MRAMSPPRVQGPSHALSSPRVRTAAGRVLAWSGLAATITGAVVHDLFEGWRPPRTLAILVVAGLLLAWPLRRFARCSWASAIALYWCALLPVFADPLPVAATLLAAAAATALGGTLLRDEDLAARCIAGTALAAGVLGWLMPLPIHLRWIYLAACAALLAWQWRPLWSGLRSARVAWTDSVATAPLSAAFAVMLLGLAGTGGWLPTLQHDDIGYHLYLPWSLMLDGRHPLDPEYHAWALAPWFADVVQAVPQVLAGAEARGAVNALWLALAASGLWRLCLALGGDARAAWWTVAAWASLPLTAALAGGMQTELPTTALLAWLVVLGHRPASMRGVLAMALLAGALVATKLAAAAMALALLPWLAWRQRAALGPATVAVAMALMALVGGASYAFAAVIAGNPLLPLANGMFGSPYFPAEDFSDPRWQAGFDAALPWHLTFDTARYLEADAGAGGVVLVALAGTWLLAIAMRRTRAFALLTLALMAGLLATSQYLRYVYPLLALALPALVVATTRAEPRHWMLLLAPVIVLNLALQPRGHWMLGANVVKHALSARGADAPLYETFAPERQLAAIMRETMGADARGNVLMLSDFGPMPAEFGRRARTIIWYDPSLAARAATADRDASGEAWIQLLRDEGIGEVMLRPDELSPPRRAALERLDARPRAAVGRVEWWQLPPAGDTP